MPYCNVSGVIKSGSICYDSTWTSGQVIGNELAMQIDGFNTTNRISLYSHEWGHMLSLAHTNKLAATTGAATVMQWGKQDVGPQAVDKEHLIMKWGK